MKKYWMTRILTAVLGVALVLPLAGCSGSDASGDTDAGAEETAVETIRLGLAPDEDSAAVLAKYEPFVEYLSQATGLTVEPFVGADYTAVIEALNSGHLDVAWFGPSEYILATEAVGGGVEAFASATQAEGTIPYRTSFIVRADSGIDSLEDMEGKSLAFTDPASTSGHIFGRYSLVQEGYDPEEYFSQVIYSGSHDACLLAVVNGQVDVAAVSSRKIPGFIDSGLISEDDIKVVYESVEIPPDPITYRADLSEDLKEKLQSAFLSDSPDLAASLDGTGFAGFAPVEDADYDLVREAYEVAGLEPEV